jgi:hypothetical protein
MRPLRHALLPVLALMLLHSVPARAGTVDTPACKRDLTTASAGVSDAMARMKGLTKAAGEDKCAAYRQHFLIVVKARAVIANCKTGPDRDADVGRLDGTIEDINGVIAASCGVQ